MSKRSRIFSLIMVMVLLGAVCTGCGCSKKPSENDEVNVKTDDPAWHGNGMEVLPSSGGKTDDVEEQTDPKKLEYSLRCRFEGKMDENSFEVTELDIDTETGEFVEGQLLQLRVGNDSVREDINIAEIGENLTVLCKYNEDSQLVAERIIILEG